MYIYMFAHIHFLTCWQFIIYCTYETNPELSGAIQKTLNSHFDKSIPLHKLTCFTKPGLVTFDPKVIPLPKDSAAVPSI